MAVLEHIWVSHASGAAHKNQESQDRNLCSADKMRSCFVGVKGVLGVAVSEDLLPARRLSSSVLSQDTGQVHDTSVGDQENSRTDVLTGDGVEAIDPNTIIEDHDGF